MTTANVHGITVEYDVHGEGEPLMLVMGLGGQMVAWPIDWVNRFVDRGFQVIRFDNRDIGLTTKSEGPRPTRRRIAGSVVSKRFARSDYQIGDMADDDVALLDHLGIERAHVVGMSMGGMIAQSMAIRHPSRVASLTSIMSTTGSRRVGRPKAALLRKLAGLGETTQENAADNWLQIMRSVSGPHFDEAAMRSTAAESLARNFDDVGPSKQLMAIAASPDRTPDLRRLKVPTLVIHGLLDQLVAPSGGVATAKAVPGSRLLMFPDMAHDLPRPRWDELVEAIIANARRGGFTG